MKIAVLMVGRIAKFEECYKSHYMYIFQNNDVDVYLAHNSNNVNDNIDLFKKIYNVKKIISLKVDISDFEKYPIPLNIGVNGRNCVIMFTCLNEVFKIIPEATYDVILYMRADELVTSKLGLQIPLNKDTVYIPFGGDYVGGINDQFAYGNYDSMRKYCSIIENLHRFLEEKRVIFHPENINRYNLEYNNLNIVRFQLDYRLFKITRLNNSTLSILKTIRKYV